MAEPTIAEITQSVRAAYEGLPQIGGKVHIVLSAAQAPAVQRAFTSERAARFKLDNTGERNATWIDNRVGVRYEEGFVVKEGDLPSERVVTKIFDGQRTWVYDGLPGSSTYTPTGVWVSTPLSDFAPYSFGYKFQQEPIWKLLERGDSFQIATSHGVVHVALHCDQFNFKIEFDPQKNWIARTIEYRFSDGSADHVRRFRILDLAQINSIPIAKRAIFSNDIIYGKQTVETKTKEYAFTNLELNNQSEPFAAQLPPNTVMRDFESKSIYRLKDGKWEFAGYAPKLTLNPHMVAGWLIIVLISTGAFVCFRKVASWLLRS